jgi:GTP-binding protein
MEITQATYLISSPSVEQCPKPDRPEYAFIGRSNVGKSSVINMLTNKKELAKVSRSPGKTQLINHFEITSADKSKWFLVDLPGYGYAKRSMTQRKTWEKMIENYIRKRENLVNLFVLIDSRLDPQKNDLEFLAQLAGWQIPFSLIFTKADKVTQKETAANVDAFLKRMREEWEELPKHFVTSAVKHLGAKQLRAYISELNVLYTRYQKEKK